MPTLLKLFPFFASDMANALYLQSADIEANEGRGFVEVTPDKKHAMQFASPLEALEFWKQQSQTYPLRQDGKPNRPLTAFHAMLEHVEKEK